MGFDESFAGTVEQCLGPAGKILKVRFDVDGVLWTVDTEKHGVTLLPGGAALPIGADPRAGAAVEANQLAAAQAAAALQSPRMRRWGQPR